MTKKIENAIEIIKNLTPKTFGIKNAFYKIDDNSIDVLFIVDKKSASNSISYLKSLGTILEKEVRNVTIKTSVFIHERGKDTVDVAKKEKYQQIRLLNNLNFKPA